MSATIKELSEVHELRELADLLAVVWGRPGEPSLDSDVLKALSHSGNYVAGGYQEGRLIGGLVGWFGGMPPHELHLHSHILGVIAGNEARGLGFELKQHQRRWCLERGVKVMEWTTDPAVRRNAYFNLSKLGAHAPAYLVDFYGEMADGINAGEESDRLLIRWTLDAAEVEAAAAGHPSVPDLEKLRGWGCPAILAVGQSEEPVIDRSSARILLCQVPEDIVVIRRNDPGLAREWRMALREALGGSLASGYEIAAATRSGWYVLEKQ
ncbi:MAG: GNAT family N-acetyltransferase [Candidatus Dormibacteraceae bacterium]